GYWPTLRCGSLPCPDCVRSLLAQPKLGQAAVGTSQLREIVPRTLAPLGAGSRGRRDRFFGAKDFSHQGRGGFAQMFGGRNREPACSWVPQDESAKRIWKRSVESNTSAPSAK